MSLDLVPYVCLVVAALLIYVPRPVALWAQSRFPGGIDNAHPRAQQTQLVGLGARAQAAHANGIEAFGPFAAGVLACGFRGVDALPVAVLAVTFVALRTAYVGLYLGNLPTARSAVWGVGAVCSLGLLVLPLTLPASAGPLGPDDPIRCGSCDDWNAPREPFRVFGNTYYVGVEGLSAVLIATDDGLVLLDGDLPQSVPVIAAHVATLGFDPKQVRMILASHAHFDHIGGIAALQAMTGATVGASPAAAVAMAAGRPTPDDPQFAYGKAMRFAPVASVRSVADGETVEVGGTAITAHHTPGHTPGGTTWTWRSCEGDTCLDLVYADSLNPVSAPRYRFADHPEVVASLRQSIALVAGLPCDVLLSVHPDASATFERLAAGGLVDPDACRAYAAKAEAKLDKRLAEENPTDR